MKNLVIVESPAKARTIEGFLGKEFRVEASFGHIRDLPEGKGLGVDVANGFQPDYQVSSKSTKRVSELRAAVKQSEVVWLASDEDREGEAIAWHLTQVLNLDPTKTRRIVFHEITKAAIARAVESPRTINMNLVDAQQARRILDRLVGYEVSPVLWKKVKPSLSAGRVQSVAVRLVVDREREISQFEAAKYYRIVAELEADGVRFKAELGERLAEESQARAYVTGCQGARFEVTSVTEKPGKRTPAPPFTTSTLQQEASRKLGMNAQRTMRAAQTLYEAGHITYMRTDSVNLSDQALGEIGREIESRYGKEYHQLRRFQTKSKGAQEAHEAIRPTHPEVERLDVGLNEKRLYKLIRDRALASQMADARLLKTTVLIQPSGAPFPLQATGEVVEFDGFLRLYLEGKDDENSEQEGEKDALPRMHVGEFVQLHMMEARERYAQHPPRYSEASLVKRLEELGIGRPSTYAPTMTVIEQRGYVEQGDREGRDRNVWTLRLTAEGLRETKVVERTGAERRKLFPTDIGMVVTDFLVEHFAQLLSYDFTAQVEREFDRVAEGEISWREMLEAFYGPFHKSVEETSATAKFAQSERVLGKDPATGLDVLVRIGRFGPLVQLGSQDQVDKPRFASLSSSQLIETITLEEALDQLKLPRELGEFESQPVTIGVGRFGPYAKHAGVYTSLNKEDDPMSITLEEAIARIEAKRQRDAQRVLRTYPEDETLQVLNGRWGPYLVYQGANYKLQRGVEVESLSYTECMRIVSEQPGTTRGGWPKKEASKGKESTGPKKTTTKKTTGRKGGTGVKRKSAGGKRE